MQVGPGRGHQGPRPIGQYQVQEQFAAPAAPAQYVERHALKGMALADDLYLAGIVIEVGSLSSGLLTA